MQGIKKNIHELTLSVKNSNQVKNTRTVPTPQSYPSWKTVINRTASEFSQIFSCLSFKYFSRRILLKMKNIPHQIRSCSRAAKSPKAMVVVLSKTLARGDIKQSSTPGSFNTTLAMGEVNNPVPWGAGFKVTSRSL